jgi:hypothetical protein
MSEDQGKPLTGFDALESLKLANQAELEAMPPAEAQAAVDCILYPRLWRVADDRQLPWPGDLADDDWSDDGAAQQ